MSSLPAQHGHVHEECVLGYAIGLDADLRREDDVRDLVARCDECLSFSYRTLADLRALSGGDTRAGARLEQLLRTSLEAIAWRDHTVAYNQLYGGASLSTDTTPRGRRWLPFGSMVVVAVAVVLLAVVTGRSTIQHVDEATATIEVVEAGAPGEPLVRVLTEPADVAQDQLMRLRMPLPTRAISSPYLWIAVVTDARRGPPLVLAATLPAEAAAAIRAGVAWNEGLHTPGDKQTTGAVGAVRPGEMAIVLPARLLSTGENRIRVIAATSDPGQPTLDALIAGNLPELDASIGSVVASSPLTIRVTAGPATRPAER